MTDTLTTLTSCQGFLRSRRIIIANREAGCEVRRTSPKESTNDVLREVGVLVTMIVFFLLLLLLSVAHAVDEEKPTLCDRIQPLPEECACREPGNYSLVVECLKPMNSSYFNDTVGVKLLVEPCDAAGSSISLAVTEFNHNIDYSIAGIRAGDQHEFPIPGLSFAVPSLGNVGLDATVSVFGNPDKLTLKVGLNACAAVGHKMVCASEIPGLTQILPWWILSGTYSFGDICGGTVAIVAAEQ